MSQTEKTFIITESLLNDILSSTPSMKEGTNGIASDRCDVLSASQIFESDMKWVAYKIEEKLSYVKRCPAK